eukprot:1298677-Pyramimonas_sp.AAC.1
MQCSPRHNARSTRASQRGAARANLTSPFAARHAGRLFRNHTQTYSHLISSSFSPPPPPPPPPPSHHLSSSFLPSSSSSCHRAQGNR